MYNFYCVGGLHKVLSQGCFLILKKVANRCGVVSNVWMIVSKVLEGSGCGRI